MSLTAIRTGGLANAIAAKCEKLVHPDAKGADRARQTRLIGLTLASPFLVAATMAPLFPAGLGIAATIGMVCAIFGAAWLAALTVAVTGAMRIVELAALAVGTLACAAIIAAAGGLASPMALIAVALPFESWWLRRSPLAIKVGAAAMGVALIGQAALSQSLFAGETVSAVHWLVPVAYAALVWLRIAARGEGAVAGEVRKGSFGIEDAIDGVVLRSSASGEIVDVSAKARDLLGVAPELLLSNGLFDRVHVADRVSYMTALADLRYGAAARRLELRLRLPASATGRTSEYRSFLVEMASAGTEKPAVLIIRANDDVAALRHDLAKARDEVAGLEIGKSRFLAAVSHELRTPLNAIIGFSDMLLYEMFGSFHDPRQKEYVTLVRESGHHLLAVVNSILDVSKIEAGAYATSPELFRFKDAVDMCQAMLRHQASLRRQRLSAYVSPEVGEICADQRAVRQMLINLVSNAVKFTPEGGDVSIGAKRIGSRVHFWVSDNGIGMSENDLALVGKPFAQVQNDYTRQCDGAGLGLSLVKGLVVLHEGTMSIESEPGNGTTVTISLPVDGPAAGKPADIISLPNSKADGKDNGAIRKSA